jgi:methyl-accepting chemotaxis protein
MKFNNLKIWQKLACMFALLSIPMGILISLFLEERSQQIRVATEELAGLEYTVPLRQMMQNLQTHRTAAAQALGGVSSAKDQLESLQRKIDDNLSSLETLDQKYSKRMGTMDSLIGLKRDWQDLKTDNLRLTAAENSSRHAKVIDETLRVFKWVGDQSAMTTDPKLDGYYLANNLLTQYGQELEDIALLRSLAEGVATRQRISAGEEVNLQYLSRLVSNYNQAAQANLKAAFRTNPGLETRLTSQLTATQSAVDSFTSLIDRGLSPTKGISASADDVATKADASSRELYRLFDATSDNFKGLVDSRISDLNSQRLTRSGVALFILLVASFLVYMISSAITKQVDLIIKLFSQIGTGNFNARAEVLGTDELGQMASNLNAMLDNTLTLIQSRAERDRIQQSIQRLLEQISGVADGDLTAEVDVTAEITGAIGDSFNFMIAELRQIIGNVQETTLHVGSSASQMQGTMARLADGSENQATAIVKASSAIEDIAQSIQQVSQNAANAAMVAEQALQNAKQGNESVQKTIYGMNSIRQQVQQTAKRIKRLGESSQEIGEIVQLIGDIADRTSILALNASIQAAMAGEAGKGFAVVAEEVERLAERSTEATKRIGMLIKSIQTDTNEAISAMEETTREVVGGSSLANSAGQTLSEIETVSQQLAQLIRSISAASQQQSRGSESVARTMTDISQVTQQTASGTRQVAVNVRELAGLAEELRSSIRRFRLPKREGEPLTLEAVASR